MNEPISKRLDAEQQAELEALAALSEDEIATTDIPEQRDWTGARRGVFHRPIKQRIIVKYIADGTKS